MKFNERGKPTYRRFFIHGALDSKQSYIDLWDREIKDKLDDPTAWSSIVYESDTILSKTSIILHRRVLKHNSSVALEISLYRDGFHINVREKTIKMREKVFGDVNHSSGWTQEIEKVAPLVNKIKREIDKYEI